MVVDAVYRAWGLEGYDVIEVDEDQDELLVCVAWPRDHWRCPECRSPNVICHDRRTRLWRSTPMGLKKVTIAMDVPRTQCHDCGCKRAHQPAFAEDRKRHTLAFERYASELLKYLTISDLARHLGLSWDTASGIDQRRLEALPRPQLSSLRRLAIDEIHSGKTHGYLTVVLDLESSVIVHVGDGRGAQAVAEFFRTLRKSRAKIEAVAMDMAGGYIKAVREHLPGAAHVFDRFHVVKLMNEKLTVLRRDLHREAVDVQQKDVLKGIRWLLLMGEETLDSSSRLSKRKAGQLSDRARLDAALVLNAPLAIAYYLKEELRLFWQQTYKSRAERFLDRWCRQADASGIRVLQAMAKTLRRHRTGLLAWYDHRISTGPLEGTNNKIKLIQHRAYGYRNKEHFRLRILTLHHTRIKLTG